MKFSIIIPIYIVNEELAKMTDDCLESLAATAPDDSETIVIDDGSPLPYPSSIRFEENGDYVKAVNAGLRAAQGDILILGNNDLIFHENWLPELVYPLQLGYDIATCWASDQDYTLEDKITSGDKFGSLWAMKRYVYEDLGGFDELFRGRFADTDYRRRMLDAGYTIGMNRNLVVKHLGAKTYKFTDPNDDEFLRGQRLFESKYGIAE